MVFSTRGPLLTFFLEHGFLPFCSGHRLGEGGGPSFDRSTSPRVTMYREEGEKTVVLSLDKVVEKVYQGTLARS
jgi:hypothetical protein